MRQREHLFLLLLPSLVVSSSSSSSLLLWLQSLLYHHMSQSLSVSTPGLRRRRIGGNRSEAATAYKDHKQRQTQEERGSRAFFAPEKDPLQHRTLYMYESPLGKRTVGYRFMMVALRGWIHVDTGTRQQYLLGSSLTTAALIRLWVY